jgi:membrane protein
MGCQQPIVEAFSYFQYRAPLQTPSSISDDPPQSGLSARCLYVLHQLKKMLRFLWRLIRETTVIYNRIGGEQSAAAFAYYALFSLVPLLALLLTLGSYIFPSENVMGTIQRYVPLADAKQNLLWFWSIVNGLEKARGSVSIASIATLAWASLRFFQSLVLSINHAWGTRKLPWWQMPVKNLIMIFAMSGALIIGTVVPALLQGFVRVLHALDSWIIIYFPMLNVGRLLTLLDISRYIGGTIVLFYCFAVLYTLAPRHRPSFAQIWIPSLLVSILLQVGQACFVNIVPNLINYSAIYGAMGSMMFLLLWVYIAGVIIISGGCLCAALAHLRVYTPIHREEKDTPIAILERVPPTKHPTP